MPRPKFKTVLFLCTGNYYRSRFSEYLFNALAEKKGLLSWRATSRGLKTWMADGQGPIARLTVERLTKMEVPFDGERFSFKPRKTTWKAPISSSPSRKAGVGKLMEEQFPAWA